MLLLARGLKCTVCLVEFIEGEDMKEMPCCHLFHPRCILPWLEKVHCLPACIDCTFHCYGTLKFIGNNLFSDVK